MALLGLAQQRDSLVAARDAFGAKRFNQETERGRREILNLQQGNLLLQ